MFLSAEVPVPALVSVAIDPADLWLSNDDLSEGSECAPDSD